MKYLRIITAFAAEPWALEKTKLVAIANFLRFKAGGGNYSAEEVAKLTKKTEREVVKSEGIVAVLPIQGVIGARMNMLDDISGGTSTELISQQLRAMLNNDSIKAIILDIDSPGGVARSVQELADEIFQARDIKPIVAQINSTAASAAYWIASQAEEVVVTPSGQGGSIGVYTMHEDVSKMLEMDGIKETLIYSGEYKVLGNSLEPLTDEAKSVMQKTVDQLAASFTRGVAKGRKTSAKEVADRFGQGLMFGAEELVDRGMADTVGTMSETLMRFGVDVNPALSRAAKPAQANAAETNWARFQDWSRRISAGDCPPPSQFEDILREAGVPKSLRALLASRVHAAVRSESGSDEAKSAVERALAELRERLNGFVVPKLVKE